MCVVNDSTKPAAGKEAPMKGRFNQNPSDERKEAAERPPDARDKILRAAIEEFAGNGFINASTNRIVKRAGVSKGLMFHYFGNKYRLYLACLGHARDVYEDYIRHGDFMKERDIFNRLLMAAKDKLMLFQQDHYLYVVLAEAYSLPNEPAFAEAKELVAGFVRDAMAVVMDGVDTSPFIDGHDPQRIISYIVTSVMAYGNVLLARYRNDLDKAFEHYEVIMAEIDEIIEFLKDGIYRKEP